MIWDYFSEIFVGRIGFTVNDGFADLFLKYCRDNKTELFNLHNTGECITAEIRYADKKNVFDAACNSGMNIVINYRKGLPWIFYRYRKRFGVPVGLLLFCVIYALLSSVVWSVDITPCTLIKEEDINDLLKEVGIEKGAFVGNIQSNDAEFYIHNKLEALSWIEINIVGSRVFVSLIEREIPEVKEKAECSDIIAAKDGEIIRADIFTGNEKILPGTAVVKGDVLVKGVVEDDEGNVTISDSDADIWARTRNVINSSTARCISVYSVKECKDKYLAYVFGFKVPLNYFVKLNNFTQNRSFIESADIILPIGIIRQNCMEKQRTELILTEEQARLIAFFDFSRSSEIFYKNTTVLERVISVSCESQVTFTGNYLCIENIAEKRIITVEDY